MLHSSLRPQNVQETLGEHGKGDRTGRIVDILGFTSDPNRSAGEMLSRSNLLTELHRMALVKHVPEDVAAIFRCLEQVRPGSVLSICVKETSENPFHSRP